MVRGSPRSISCCRRRRKAPAAALRLTPKTTRGSGGVLGITRTEETPIAIPSPSGTSGEDGMDSGESSGPTSWLIGPAPPAPPPTAGGAPPPAPVRARSATGARSPRGGLAGRQLHAELWHDHHHLGSQDPRDVGRIVEVPVQAPGQQEREQRQHQGERSADQADLQAASGDGSRRPVGLRRNEEAAALSRRPQRREQLRLEQLAL